MKTLNQSMLIIVIILLANPIYAQKWESFSSGLDSNQINCMTSNQEKVFIGTVSKGVFSSSVVLDDWIKLNNGIDIYSPGIHSITTKNEYIFAGNSQGLYISKNEGNSWDIVNSGILIPGYAPISSILSFSNNLIYCDGGSIFLSEDNGLNWSLVGSGGIFRNISSLILNGKYLYAGTTNGLLLSSADGGKSWEKIYEFPNSILSLAAEENALFVCTQTGVYLSNDLLNWTNENDGLSKLYINSFALTSKYIFTATTKGVFIAEKSSVIKWKPFNEGLVNLSVGQFAQSGNILFASTYSGEVYKLDLTLLTVYDAEEDNKISIYPNPAKTNVSIDFIVEPENLPNISVELYNLIGIQQSKLDYNVDYNNSNGQGTLNCNIENIPNGYYIIVIDNGKRKEAIPFIVNRN